jgi:hypothetical protein
MKINAISFWATFVVSVATITPTVFPDDNAANPPAMSPAEQEMMKKWQELAAPGAPHNLLARKVGQWDYHVKFRMSPDAPPQESTGSNTIEPIMGGRFILDKSTGAPEHGQPFEGLGVTGYDNIKKKFVATWIDNMSTGIITTEGVSDPSGNVVTYQGQFSCPMTGTIKKSKTIERFIDDNAWSMEMFEVLPDGKEWKNFEITYTRKK